MEAVPRRRSVHRRRPRRPVEERTRPTVAPVPLLVPPDVRFHDSWLEAALEFGGYMDGGGTNAADVPPDRLATTAGFAAFVEATGYDATDGMSSTS